MKNLSNRAPRGAAAKLTVGGLLLAALLPAQTSSPPTQNTPTFSTTSRLVFLDVTVLDRKGHVVVSGLKKDDFTITENRQRQAIFSFETPDAHLAQTSTAGPAAPRTELPATILVLDLLNSPFEDFAYIRYETRKYLEAQTAVMDSPAELMVLSNLSLELVQGFTRSRADLLSALERVPAALPWKEMNGSFWAERFGQSIGALQQIALQNQGAPGRKNVIWVGYGGPNIFTHPLPPSWVDKLNQYVHDTTNLLVDARVTLFVIYPGLRVNQPLATMSTLRAGVDLGENDPFSGDINFGVFVNETGGKLFYNRNDIDGEIARSQELGSGYYTLTYRPPPADPNGNFRRVRVTVRNSDFRVLTKSGYFAPNPMQNANPRLRKMLDIAEALRSNIVFPAIAIAVEDLTRHTDTGRLEFNILLRGKGLPWQFAAEGKSSLEMTVAGASFSKDMALLTSKVDTVDVQLGTQDAGKLADSVTRIPIQVRIPLKTNYVRVVVQSPDDERLGTVQIGRKAIEDAPDVATPEPALKMRPPLTR